MEICRTTNVFSQSVAVILEDDITDCEAVEQWIDDVSPFLSVSVVKSFMNNPG